MFGHFAVPALPGSLALLQQILQHLLLADVVHTLPEAFVNIRHQLSVLNQIVQRIVLEDAGIVSQVIEDLWLEHHVAGIDGHPVVGILLAESLDRTVLADLQHTLVLRHLHGCQRRNLSVALMKRHQLVDLHVTYTVAIVL